VPLGPSLTLAGLPVTRKLCAAPPPRSWRKTQHSARSFQGTIANAQRHAGQYMKFEFSDEKREALAKLGEYCERLTVSLYVAEFQFRYNNRENTDIFGTAIKGC
jgi:hypothetical protein